MLFQKLSQASHVERIRHHHPLKVQSLFQQLHQTLGGDGHGVEWINAGGDDVRTHHQRRTVQVRGGQHVLNKRQEFHFEKSTKVENRLMSLNVI